MQLRATLILEAKKRGKECQRERREEAKKDMTCSVVMNSRWRDLLCFLRERVVFAPSAELVDASHPDWNESPLAG